QGHLPARGLGAGGRQHRPRIAGPARHRSLSGEVTVLEIAHANLHYGAAQALRGVSLTAEAGRITCVLGRNGVGKTSLLKAVVGQHPLSSGSICLDGKSLDRMPSYERARAGIGY